MYRRSQSSAGRRPSGRIRTSAGERHLSAREHRPKRPSWRRWTVEAAAVGDKTGSVTIYLARGIGHHSIGADNALGDGRVDVGPHDLTRFLSGGPCKSIRPDLIKIDAEGYDEFRTSRRSEYTEPLSDTAYRIQSTRAGELRLFAARIPRHHLRQLSSRVSCTRDQDAHLYEAGCPSSRDERGSLGEPSGDQRRSAI